MFVGHLGVGLALKRAEPEVNLGLLFFAAMLLDVLLWVFVLLGIEQVHVPPNYEDLHYLLFTFPYSHGLAASLLWTALAFFLSKFILFHGKEWSTRGALIATAAVFSHFVCRDRAYPRASSGWA